MHAVGHFGWHEYAGMSVRSRRMVTKLREGVGHRTCFKRSSAQAHPFGFFPLCSEIRNGRLGFQRKLCSTYQCVMLHQQGNTRTSQITHRCIEWTQRALNHIWQNLHLHKEQGTSVKLNLGTPMSESSNQVTESVNKSIADWCFLDAFQHIVAMQESGWKCCCDAQTDCPWIGINKFHCINLRVAERISVRLVNSPTLAWTFPYHNCPIWWF